jgi:hypothetical protein
MAEANPIKKRIQILENLLEGKYKITRGMFKFKGEITVLNGEGLTDDILSKRKHPKAFKGPFEANISYKNVEITGDINSGSFNLVWNKWVISSLSLNKEGEIRVIIFFIDNDLWKSQDPKKHFETDKEYSIGIIGLNLLFYFINNLDINKLYVDDTHISTSEYSKYKNNKKTGKTKKSWQSYKTPSTYWKELGFTDLNKLNTAFGKKKEKKSRKRKKYNKKNSKKELLHK